MIIIIIIYRNHNNRRNRNNNNSSLFEILKSMQAALPSPKRAGCTDAK